MSDEEYTSCDIEYEECVQGGKVLLKCSICNSMFQESDQLVEHFTAAHFIEKSEVLEKNENDDENVNSTNLGENDSGPDSGTSSSQLNKRGFPARKRKVKTFEIDDVISIPVKKPQTVKEVLPNVSKRPNTDTSLPASTTSTFQELSTNSVKIC